MKRHVLSFAVLVVMIVLAFGSSDTGDRKGRHTGQPRSIEQLDAVPYSERTAEEKRRGKEWADRDLEERVRPNVERMTREREAARERE